MNAENVRRLTDRIMLVVGRAEEVMGTEAAERLTARKAHQIAVGICGHGGSKKSGGDVLGSIDWRARKQSFTSTPAGYLVGCAKRRGWITEGGRSDD